jgi:flavodoxin
MPKKKAEIEDVLEVVSDLSDMISQKFDAVDARFDAVDARFDEHDKKFDKIFSILDAHIKRIEEILQENIMRDRQQARMEDWIFQLAKKLDVKLTYNK